MPKGTGPSQSCSSKGEILPRVIIETNVLLSGLFFKGNERKLLEHSVLGRVELIVPEHVLLETRNIIARKAGKMGNSEDALAALDIIIGRAKIAKIAEYAGSLKKASGMIRDKKDAPILAAVLSLEHDYFVSGDKDFLELRLRTHIKTADLVRELEL